MTLSEDDACAVQRALRDRENAEWLLEKPVGRPYKEIFMDQLKYTDVMLDLETLGTAPGSAILSVGAVAFAPGMDPADWDHYYSGPISRLSCMATGLVADAATVIWWQTQHLNARQVYTASGDESLSVNIIAVLQDFANWYPQGARLWSNGANFDGVLVSEAYRRALLQPPYQYWEERCYRTMKNLWREVPRPEFQGTKHNALDDAVHQARHLCDIFAHVERLKAFAMNAVTKPAKIVVAEDASGGVPPK